MLTVLEELAQYCARRIAASRRLIAAMDKEVTAGRLIITPEMAHDVWAHTKVTEVFIDVGRSIEDAHGKANEG